MTDTTKREPAETRKLILDSTAQIVLEKGVAGLTIEGVAKSAGISKGGVLHHFASKKLLIDALVQQLFQEFKDAWQAFADADPVEEGKHVRAYAKATLLERDETSCQICNMIALEDKNNETMRSLWRDFLISLQKSNGKSDSDRVTLAIVQLAIDGLWLAELDRNFEDSKALHADVISRLIEMTYPVDARN